LVSNVISKIKKYIQQCSTQAVGSLIPFAS